MTAHEKVRRDAQVIADRARGLSWARIAKRNGLSARQCRSIWKEQRQQLGDPLDTREPVAVLEEALMQIDAVIEDLALLAETSRNDSVKLGAIKARHSAMGDKASLMQAVGLLPRNLGVWRTEIEARQLVRIILDVFDSHAVGDEVRIALLDALRQVVRPDSATHPLVKGATAEAQFPLSGGRANAEGIPERREALRSLESVRA